MERYARNIRLLDTSFPASILYKDIVCVVAKPDVTIRILDMFGVETIKDAKVFSSKDYTEERIAIFRAKKSELDRWFNAFEYMEKHPPTDHYLEVCEKMDGMIADYEEENK